MHLKYYHFFKGVDVIMVNCMRLDSPQAIFSKIHSNLVGTSVPKRANVEKKIINYITSSRRMMLVH